MYWWFSGSFITLMFLWADWQPNPLPFRIGTLFSLISWILHRFCCLGRRGADSTYTINQNLPIYKTSGYRVLSFFTVIVGCESQNRPERWGEQLSSPHFNVRKMRLRDMSNLAKAIQQVWNWGLSPGIWTLDPVFSSLHQNTGYRAKPERFKHGTCDLQEVP